MASVSNVTIANIALSMLNTRRIQSLTEDSENARQINAIFDTTRDSLLEEHNWNFAKTERELALLTEGPLLADWLYRYQMPSDCLRVIRMDGDDDFAVFGNALYTDSDVARIEYIKIIEDPQLFSATFVKAFASKIALDISYGITQSSTIYQLMANMYQEALNQAKWSDSQEGVGARLSSGSLIESRGV